MKYYKDTEGNLYADPASTEGFEEVLSPVSADGTILPQHGAIGQLATQEDGTRYQFYYEISDPDNIYQPDEVKIAESEAALLASDQKAERVRLLDVLTVTTTSGNVFDADDVARQDMLSAIDASTTLGLSENNWKLADNSWALIQLDELKEASALAIQAKGAILAGA